MDNHIKHHPIRSFIKRERHFKKTQQTALETLLPRYGLTFSSDSFDFDSIFGRKAPLVLEIGFGMGDSLIAMAESYPEINFIGIEVHRPGVGLLLYHLHEKKLQNVRVFCEDAVPVLTHCIADDSLEKIQIFYPDPWPKRKHHKRRLIQKDFILLAQQKLKKGGILHIKTDWEDYAKDILKTTEKMDELTRITETHTSPDDYTTKFEQRGLKRGYILWDIQLLNKQKKSQVGDAL